CTIFNPGKEVVSLTFNVLHARTTSFQTRVVHPLKIKPGKNEVSIGIDELTNVNGSAPALNRVRRWFIAHGRGKAPTLYFRDIGCGGDPPASIPTPGGSAPLVGYRIKGKVGNLDVDLTVTPFLIGKTEQKAVKVQGDPARLARIRKAKMPKITKPILFNTPEA